MQNSHWRLGQVTVMTHKQVRNTKKTLSLQEASHQKKIYK